MIWNQINWLAVVQHLEREDQVAAIRELIDPLDKFSLNVMVRAVRLIVSMVR